MPHGTVNNPLVFVSIAPDGIVTIVCHRSEMGQGVRTGMPLIVADELEADWSRVKVAQAPGDEVKFGNQDTDGSRSTRHFFKPMRQVGAAARMMLEAAAAKRWGVPVADVEAKNHEVVQKSTGDKARLWRTRRRRQHDGRPGERQPEKMARDADSLRLKDPSQFRYIGKEGTNIVDGFDITTGRAIYGQDVRLPGMKYAVIARPPVMGGKVASYDARDAKKVPGVVQIVEIPAPPIPLAFQPSGRHRRCRRQHLGGDSRPQGAEDRVGRRPATPPTTRRPIATALEATARKPGKVVRTEGDFAAAFASADKKVEAEYYIPHLAHATMEPPSATAASSTARRRSGRACKARRPRTIWSPSTRSSARQRHRPCDASGRRLRPQIEAGLRGRGGPGVERDRRRLR